MSEVYGGSYVIEHSKAAAALDEARRIRDGIWKLLLRIRVFVLVGGLL